MLLYQFCDNLSKYQMILPAFLRGHTVPSKKFIKTSLSDGTYRPSNPENNKIDLHLDKRQHKFKRKANLC